MQKGHPRVAFLHGTWACRANNRLRLSAVVAGSRRITPVAYSPHGTEPPPGWPSSVARGPGRANNRLRLSAVVAGSRRITPVAYSPHGTEPPPGWPSSVARGPGGANNRLRLSAVAAGYRRITPVAYSSHGTEVTPGWPCCVARGPGRANNRLRLSAVAADAGGLRRWRIRPTERRPHQVRTSSAAQRRQVAQFHQLDVRFADALEMFATGFVHRFAAVQQQGATAGNVDQLRSRREVRGP